MARNPLTAAGVFEPDPTNPLTGSYSAANAMDWHRQNMRDAWAAAQDPQTWQDAAHQYGNALLGSVAAPGSGSTQIAGTTPMYSKAIQWLLKQHPEAASVLDYGAGLGLGADAMRLHMPPGGVVHTLEVNPERWRGSEPPTYTDDSQIAQKYDLITNTNVLNVLPKAIRDGVVRNIGDTLAPGGKALITTRGWSGDVAATKGGLPGDEPRSINVMRGDQPVFQKGFDPAELHGYVSELLGDGFQVERAPGFGKAGILVTKHHAPQAADIAVPDGP
jgi:SAM-dependent methyltransferase